MNPRVDCMTLLGGIVAQTRSGDTCDCVETLFAAIGVDTGYADSPAHVNRSRFETDK